MCSLWDGDVALMVATVFAAIRSTTLVTAAHFRTFLEKQVEGLVGVTRVSLVESEVVTQQLYVHCSQHEYICARFCGQSLQYSLKKPFAGLIAEYWGPQDRRIIVAGIPWVPRTKVSSE